VALAAWPQHSPVYAGPETVVTAARIEQRLSDTLRSVTVITARDLEQAGQLTFAQVLQEFGGVEIVANGGPGTATSVFIRGSNSTHTLVLVDGIRLASATNGTTAFENIPVDQIERIEIVAGPVSGLYGSDAIGGVIQIFTKSGRYSPGLAASAGYGSYNTRSARASLASKVAETDFSLSASHFETDGFSATLPIVSFGRYNPDDDGYRNTSFSGKVSHRLDPHNELGASVLYSQGLAHFDNGPTTDDRTDQTLATYSVYSRNQVTQVWESLLRIGSGRDQSTSLGGFAVSEFRTDQDQATWQNTVKFGTTSLIGGVEYVGQKIDTTTAYDVTKRNIRSVFAGLSGDYGNHGVQADVRRDDNSQFGQPTTGSFAYGYTFAPAAKVRAAYGTAFHAPTFNDLYFPGFGNADLQPERSRNVEAGLDYRAGQHQFSATAFDNRVSDLIVFTFDPVTSTSRPENVAKARIRGVELSYTGRVLDTQLRAKLSVQDPKADSTGFQLQRRAKRYGSVIANRTVGSWRVGAELVASGERFDSANESPASRLGGYGVVNLTVARSFTPEWSVEARWNNVANRKYELVQGFATPGSNVFVSVKWAPLR
jgi:vitamin B12 transporter